MSERDEMQQGEPSEQHAGQAAGKNELAEELSNLARDLQQKAPNEMLEAIVRAAVEMIPGVEEGSISVVTGRQTVSSEVATSDLPKKLDALQMETNEGPCLDAVYEHKTVRIADMDDETRWPTFSRRAAEETGVRGMLAFQLFVENDNLGALNLFSTHSDAFTDDSEDIGLLVAAHAAVAFAESRKVSQLGRAVDNRDLIGQAKGILMERHGVTGQQAFFILAEASNRTNTKLYEIARHLVDSGELSMGKK